MKRRALLLAGGAWLACPATRSLAQTPKAVRRVGALLPGTPEGYRSRFEAFRAELRKLGHHEGRDIWIESRWAEDRTSRLPSLAAELVALGPVVILTGTSAGVAACKKATATIPIVFATARKPVEQGFVSSLRRPGGNITGVIVHEMERKLVEVAREALPQARRLAILVHEPDPIHKEMLDAFVGAAGEFKFEPVVVRVRRVEELALAFNEIVRRKPDALVLPTLAFLFSNHRYLIERSLEARLPLLTGFPEAVAAGGLLSYGTSREENYRRAAHMVDKILRGAKPADLAVELPERIQLTVNRKTAKAIGVELSPVTMLRADRIID